MNKLINQKIRLEESSHIYLLDDPEDISFTSVTTFVGKFFDEFDMSDFLLTVKDETENMTDLLEIVEKNIPTSKDNFPLIESTHMCGYCNFRELCGR